eukprot:ANDGO_04571.mRNA.1 Calpain
MSKFEDPDFPANAKSLGTLSGVDVSQVKWRRPSEMSSSAHLFTDGIEPGDVQQGQLGDCWFLSAQSVLALRDDLLRSVIVSWDQQTGKCVFRFTKFGEVREVVIDDRLPCTAQGSLLFASGLDPNEFWVPLMEKAYAKLHKNYGNLCGGFITDGLCDLIGGGSIGQTIQFSAVTDANAFWETIDEWINSGTALLGCAKATQGEREVDTGRGILAGHAYSVLRSLTYKGEKLIQLRNPWGCTEWTGKWSDVDKAAWTPQTQKDLGHSLQDDGTFFINFADFMQEFSKLYVCYIPAKGWNRYALQDKWSTADGSAGGCANNKTWVRNPQIVLRNLDLDTATVLVSLQQPDERFVEKPHVYIGVSAFNNTANAGKAVSRYTPVEKSTVTNLREVTIRFLVPPNSEFIVLPFTFEANTDANFLLNVVSDNKLSVSRLGGAAAAQIAEPEAPKEPVVSTVTAVPDDPGRFGTLMKYGKRQFKLVKQEWKNFQQQSQTAAKDIQKDVKKLGDQLTKSLKKFF